ncbi:MAG: AlkA N-terminal domain-containing protein, partial [Actinomycetota bacterium]
LDADPVAVRDALAGDPLLAAAVARHPGLRAPGAVGGAEMAVRAIAGQAVSVAAARAAAARLVALHGTPLPDGLAEPDVGPTHLFPRPDALAGADPAAFPMPRTRAEAVRAVGREVAAGRLALDPGADRDAVAAALRRVRGVGPWTAAYVQMRALGDPDVFLATDLGVRRALAAAGGDAAPPAAARRAEAWRPWRSYAVHHLWASSS